MRRRNASLTTIASLVLAVSSLSSLLAAPLWAQVYSPRVMTPDQVDTTDLQALAHSIIRNAHASTDREKAEAIWRFYLTDGRFVKPGMFYHIPGWAYEEPLGEVLDPIKLLNTYGFGLCYQDAPLLQATWEAGGFAHARVWFLTGHTVAEVFYDGQFHYYDSDMMGYTTIGDGSPKTSPVASVQQLAYDRSILLGKLQAPKEVKVGAVDSPWYNADVRAGAIGDLADLFSSTNDNYLYAYDRYPHGHTMDFVLRRGERMVRYYNQPDSSVRYLPYKYDGNSWQEFTSDYGGALPVKNGPKSEKDARRWSTGFLEYLPDTDAMKLAEVHGSTPSQAVYTVTSPYVIMGAEFSMQASLTDTKQSLVVETSTDDGRSWTLASSLQGAHTGEWKVTPATLAHTAQSSYEAVSGSYGYQVRITLRGNSNSGLRGSVSSLRLLTSFEFNPRTLPILAAGTNVLNYDTTSVVRTEIPVHASDAKSFAQTFSNAGYHSEAGQGYLQNAEGKQAEIIFRLSAEDGPSLNQSHSLPTDGELTGFDAGARFLDLQDGLAPNKLTAEVRKVAPWPTDARAVKSATIEWSVSMDGPWKTIWKYDPAIAWPDGKPVRQMLRWPEVDRSVRELKAGTKIAYVRYRFQNLAVDDIRLATIQPAPKSKSRFVITHSWTANGKPAEHVETIDGSKAKNYRFDIPADAAIEDQALVFAVR